jgi:pyrimidine-nucleoside phosphorylase
VLTVKFGTAAFMPTLEKAHELGRAMVALANESGVKTRALLTDMHTPLGRTAGNWLEVRESVECLENRGPKDLRELVLACAAHLLVQTGKAKTLDAALRRAADCLASGKPRQKWNEMLAAQGADLAAFNRKLAPDNTAPVVVELKASASGFVSRCDARVIGEVVRELGGGRFTKESAINYDVGVDALAKPGEPIRAGGVLTRIHAADPVQAEAAGARLEMAFEISSQPPALRPLIAEII